MNDSEILECKDHGGDHGLSCGFFAKYANLADLHIERVHLDDPTPMEIVHRFPPALRRVDEKYDIAENYPAEKNYSRRHFVWGPTTHLLSLVGLYTALGSAIILFCLGIVWVANQVTEWWFW